MTIQTQTSKVVYVADGSTANFIVPFYFFNQELVVYKNNSTTPLVYNVDYQNFVINRLRQWEQAI